MSFMNKVKNFFYEDVEEDVEETRVEEPKKKFNPFKKEPKVEEKVSEEVRKNVKQEANNDLSERELFKSERTFNFPMDLGDEIFDKEEPEVVTKQTTMVKNEPVKESYTRSIYRNISKEEPKVEEKKKFRPSPVISPVYGILDKNYTVDDVVDADKTKEFSFDKKVVDYDSVRNRAYKDIDNELEKTMNNDIFYNLDEEINEEQEDLHVEEPSVIITYDEIEEEPVEAKEVEFKEVEVKEEIPEEKEIPVIEPSIPEEEEDDEEDIAPDVKIETPKKKTKKVKETKKDEKKEDLFNLIENMYNEDEEEEDE